MTVASLKIEHHVVEVSVPRIASAGTIIELQGAQNRNLRLSGHHTVIIIDLEISLEVARFQLEGVVVVVVHSSGELAGPNQRQYLGGPVLLRG